MLARCNVLKHPNSDFTVDLPLLVPSFTSKGFGEKKIQGKKRSEIVSIYNDFGGNDIRNSILISAYDMHHHYCKPEKNFTDKELIFIDSGGYELCKDYDCTEVKRPHYKPRPFSKKNYISVLKNIPKNLPIIISNYDWGTSNNSVEEQILKAQSLFNQFPFFGHNFIAKARSQEVLDVDKIIINVKKLRRFHILGFAEKELGKNLLDKLVNTAQIRIALDRAEINMPIHIYGGLDPTITPLYFFAGAEIFDGVSWLRYAFKDGVAIYHDSHRILCPDLGVEVSDYQAFNHRISNNIVFLQKQMIHLRCFVNKKAKDFSMFGVNAEHYAKAYAVLSTKIPELKGDL